jgi:hypothetical protein
VGDGLCLDCSAADEEQVMNSDPNSREFKQALDMYITREPDYPDEEEPVHWRRLDRAVQLIRTTTSTPFFYLGNKLFVGDFNRLKYKLGNKLIGIAYRIEGSGEW